jgi:sulfite exporter TauE/SafE/copper chaperone CopZ
MEKGNTTITLRVRDMSCGACEQRIERGLAGRPGVSRVRADHVRGTVRVAYDPALVQLEAIKTALGELHYPASEDSGGRGGRWARSALIAAALAAAYFVLDRLGVFYLFPTAQEGAALPVLFVIGLLTSVHCVSMCGGINLSQCARSGPASPGGGGAAQRVLPAVLYNGGRVLSYTLVGGIVGALGSVISPPGEFQGLVAAAAGVFMLIMGLNMLGLFPALGRLAPRLPRFLTKGIDRGRAGKGPFVVGLLNGLMPCGPLQAMQFYALSAGGFFLGALSMLLFSLGTTPLMFALGALSSFLSSRFTQVMMRVSAVLVLVLGIMMLNNGLSLSGLNPLFF